MVIKTDAAKGILGSINKGIGTYAPLIGTAFGALGLWILGGIRRGVRRSSK